MAKPEEIEKILSLFEIFKPNHCFEEIQKTDMGMFAVLKYLREQKKPVKSKEISDGMQVSSARMAILLKKLEAKNLIEKSHSQKDKRITLVELTEEGFLIDEKIRSHIYQMAEQMIDEIGIEELEKTFINLQKIHFSMIDLSITIFDDAKKNEIKK